MIDAILVKRPITDGSSQYTVRLPKMETWTNHKTLLTEEDLQTKVQPYLPQIIDLRGL